MLQSIKRNVYKVSGQCCLLGVRQHCGRFQYCNWLQSGTTKVFNTSAQGCMHCLIFVWNMQQSTIAADTSRRCKYLQYDVSWQQASLYLVADKDTHLCHNMTLAALRDMHVFCRHMKHIRRTGLELQNIIVHSWIKHGFMMTDA